MFHVKHYDYDVVVVGGGHAGIEAAVSSSRIGAKTLLITLPLMLSGSIVYAMSDLEIKQICKTRRKRLTCKKNLELQRSILQKGKRIEIPVIPFRN